MTLQECIGDRMRLAGVVMQVDWQTVLQGSQMMQQPKEFARLSEENVATNMDRIRKEAASRGWLSNDLPSGKKTIFAPSACNQHDNAITRGAMCKFLVSPTSLLASG